jgi:CHAD domain-containing protein
VVAAARAVLAARHAKALGAGENLGELDAPGLHRLRIRMKQLRYAVEFFAELFPGRAPRRYASALADLQDCLGLLQDVAVTEPLLASLAGDGESDARSRGGDKDLLAHAAGLVSGWQAAAARRARARLDRRFQRFTERRRFWEA